MPAASVSGSLVKLQANAPPQTPQSGGGPEASSREIGLWVLQTNFLYRMRPRSVRCTYAWSQGSNGKSINPRSSPHESRETAWPAPRPFFRASIRRDEAVAGWGIAPGSAMPCPREQSRRTADDPTVTNEAKRRETQGDQEEGVRLGLPPRHRTHNQAP